MSILRTFFIFFVLSLLSTPAALALTLTNSPPITAVYDGQIIENVRITANGEPAIVVKNVSNVIIRNVEIEHQGAPGIKCSNADGLTIENAAITHTGPGVPLADSSENNIDCFSSDGVTITAVRLEGGSSGVYLLESPNSHLRLIEGYDFRGPFPRGQLVQFNQSPFCILEDFSAIHDPLASWPEDNVSVYQSDNCTILRGLLDGNNSTNGVAVMFEQSSNGLLEDVDAIRQANGNFSAWPAYNITYRRSRVRDNICTDQGRGLPSSNGLVWSGKPGSTALRIEDSYYYNLCNPNNKVWDKSTFDIIDISSLNFQTRDPIVNIFPWEGGAIADFTSSISGLTVNFTDNSSSNGGSITKWSWDFGDGSVSTSANPSHTYSQGGTYTVSLTVTDSQGDSDSLSKKVTLNKPPVAGFNFSVSGLTASFSDTSSDSDGSIAKRSWNFGDGSTSTSTNPSHTYAAAGTYTVTLTVTDNQGASDSVSQNVTLTSSSTAPNQPPTSGYSYTVSDLTVSFKITAFDSDGSIVQWYWNFGDGGISITSNPGPNPGHIFATSGTYTVSLTVTDDDGASDTFSQNITVTAPNQAPTAGFNFSVSDLTAKFTDTSTDSDGFIANRSWNFGDGGTSTSTNPSHTYTAAGTYTVSLKVTDDDGASNTISQSVTVTKPVKASTTATSTSSFWNLYCFLRGGC